MTAVVPVRLIVVAGPTGTGKSATAILLAERLGGEIVGCDAVQVYRGFDVGTAKPTAVELGRVPHHLIDVADPRRDFTLADYVKLSSEAIEAIVKRGSVPIVVGGTGLYLRGLLRGIVDAPARDESLRARLRRVATRRGPASLHRWLARLDPPSAARVATGDSQRIVRALELALTGPATWSERLRRDGTWGTGPDRFLALKIGLDLDRTCLKNRLRSRVDSFFEGGLVEEVRGLVASGIPPTANAFKAIGYREVLREVLAGGDPAAVRGEVALATSRYAKRQRTWFRKEPGIVWIDAAQGPEACARSIASLWLGER